MEGVFRQRFNQENRRERREMRTERERDVEYISGEEGLG